MQLKTTIFILGSLILNLITWTLFWGRCFLSSNHTDEFPSFLEDHFIGNCTYTPDSQLCWFS